MILKLRVVENTMYSNHSRNKPTGSSFFGFVIIPMLILLLGYCTFNSSALAADKGYIEAVMADVAEFETDEFKPPADSTWIGSADMQSETSGELLAKLEDFSRFLKDKSPGSFIFYSKLPEDYKKRLHQEYLATGNLNQVKKNIFKYSKDIKK